MGPIHDLFIREASSYMWQNISLDRDGWDKVTPAEKNGLIQHLRVINAFYYVYFDLVYLCLFLIAFYLSNFFLSM